MSGRSIVTMCVLIFVALVASTGATGKSSGCTCFIPAGMESLGPTPPKITFFTADKDNISPGTPVTLSWSIFDADSAWIDGAGMASTSVNSRFGTMGIHPTVTSTYTLHAKRDDPVVPEAQTSIIVHVIAATTKPPTSTQGTGQHSGTDDPGCK